MKTKTTLILLAVVVALGVWIKFYESKRPNTEEATRRATNVLNFDREKLEGLVIQNGDDRIELRRVDNNWRVETPIKDQADRYLVDGLISNLESWQKEETISAKEIDQKKLSLEEYDLVKPKLRLKMLGKDMPPEIWFGREAALEGKMYVRFENGKDTFLASQAVRKEITKKPEEFRDRKLTDLTAAQVARAVVKTPAGEMEVQKQSDHWEIVKPLRARGDTQKISDLIAQVTSARIEQFVADDRGDLQPYGLAEPRGSITLFKAGDKEGQTAADRHSAGEQGAGAGAFRAPRFRLHSAEENRGGTPDQTSRPARSPPRAHRHQHPRPDHDRRTRQKQDGARAQGRRLDDREPPQPAGQRRRGHTLAR